MIETWYILETGDPGDPHDIAPDDKGVLRHKDGRAVAYAPHGPRSRSVDAVAERAKAAASRSAKVAESVQVQTKPSETAKPAQSLPRDMHAARPGFEYKTR